MTLRSKIAAALAALLLAASPVLADWSEIVGTGGPTSGRLRWTYDSTGDITVVLKRVTGTPTNALHLLESDNTLTAFTPGVLGGSGGSDVLVSLTAFTSTGNAQVTIVGVQDNGDAINDRAAHAWLRTNDILDGGPWNTSIVNTSQKGASFGFYFKVLTHDSVDRWALTSNAEGTGKTFEWHGGASMPGSASTTFESVSSANMRGTEGCTAHETTTPALFGVGIRDSGAVLVSRFVAAGQTAITTTPSGWGSGDTIQIGQCFMIGTRFVVVADNVTDGNVFVGIVGTTPSFEQTQTISGDVVGGVALSGTGYIMASDGTLYSSDGTTTFADASDTFSGGTPLLLSLNGAGDAVLVWDADGDISERIFPPIVTTGAASSITQTTATLNGTVNPNGLATTGSFDYGLTTGYGSTASAGSLGSGAGDVAATADITGLTCGTTYHFRATAANADGTTNGSDATFATSACSSGGVVEPAITFRAVGFEPGGFKPEGFAP